MSHRGALSLYPYALALNTVWVTHHSMGHSSQYGSQKYGVTHCIESTLSHYDFVEESSNTPDIHLIIIVLCVGGRGEYVHVLYM